MRSHLANRLRSSSLSAVPPPRTSSDYSNPLAKAAASILYRTPLPSQDGLPIYILNAAALPDADEVDYDSLLPYVLARLPGEEELLSGTEYEVIFFAGGGADGATSSRKNRPGWGWFIQAYHVLSRAMRKRLQKLYIVHERSWVRILVEMFSTIVSPKFRRKIVHASSLTHLAMYLPLEDLLIPPSAYLHDRRLQPEIEVPYESGRRAFSARHPLPTDYEGRSRLPRVLRETTTFILMEPNVKTEGLFRIPPHTKLRDILREAYDRGQKFIIWKEYNTMLPIPAYSQVEGVESVLDEVDQKDAYGVHLAASLIKMWYAELRHPLFPQSSYESLRNTINRPDCAASMEVLTEIVSPKTEWPSIPAVSRELLVRHLLPLLSAVAKYEKFNMMDSFNLAVCFAPALVRGPDPIEDAKMSPFIRQFLTGAIDMWPKGLRDACQTDDAAFQRDLVPPANPQDYEDPLEYDLRSSISDTDEIYEAEKHSTGIVMHDDDADKSRPPPLPPRPSNPAVANPFMSDSPTKRKPAPSISVPPRYSTMMADESGHNVAESPISYTAVADGFAPPRPSGWSISSMSKDRKDSIPEDSIPGMITRDSPSPPHITLPKRKALTAEQIGNVESAGPVQQRLRNTSNAKIPLPRVRAVSAAEAAKRKPVHSRAPSEELQKVNGASPSELGWQPGQNSHPDHASTTDSNDEEPNHILFAKPRWPASAKNIHNANRITSGPYSTTPDTDGRARSSTTSRSPVITSLARQVYPSSSVQERTEPLTLPLRTIPKVRAPSHALLQRIPSFEAPQNSDVPSSNEARLRAPLRKLDLKQPSVDNLRRLYEERAGTAKSLVKAATPKGETSCERGPDYGFAIGHAASTLPKEP